MIGEAEANVKRIAFNHGWEFIFECTDDFISGASLPTDTVDLPHTVRETPFSYFDEHIYQTVCGYRKRFAGPEDWAGKRVFLNIGAAAHFAEVFVDGKKLGEHRGGYTAFRVELTDALTPGAEATVAVRLDTRESLDFPPFGFVIDYMTYGGLYREVDLLVAEQTYVDDLFVVPTIPDGEALLTGAETPEEIAAVTFTGSVEAKLSVVGDGASSVRLTVFKRDSDSPIAETTIPLGDPLTFSVPGAHLWDALSPKLYELEVTLLTADGKALDTRRAAFGFRRARFEAGGLYLNGRKYKLTGLDRHQSYPYVGYAMPRSIQRADADILRRELGCSAVRTSHYPQSHHFIERCDELGMLVFTEIPGWQHIGGDEWKNVAVQSVREMVTEYRNHPSIILWGVRINESVDDDEFYTRTNAAAHELDPTRQTGGVRCYKRSHLLEDVYTYNDFVHTGDNRGCDKKKDVTSDMQKGYLVTEYGGHMFPTKSYDCEEHRLEHTLRHARVLDAVAGEDDIAGSFGWCMFDYNTHKDFGSGDRICHHGVCDMFRNPKTAAAVYAAMQDETPVLEITSSMDIGEHPASVRGRVYAITNADSVKMYKNGKFIREFTRADSPFANLARGPIEINDFVGDQLVENEGFTARQASLVKEIMNYTAVHGYGKLPAKIKLKAAWLIVRYRMKIETAYELYGKYVSNWGSAHTEYRFDAIKDGSVAKSVTKTAATSISLDVRVDHTYLADGDTYDAAAIRVRAVDQCGNVLPYMMESVALAVEGPIAVIGPDRVQLRGGMGGTYIRTAGEAGKASLTLTLGGAAPVRIEFDVTTED